MSTGTLRAKSTEVKAGALLIGKRIAFLRKLHDMTQEELAHKIGYEHHTALVMIERGYSYPVWEKAERLAAVFGITLQELLAVKDDHRPWLTPPMLKTLWDLRYRENGRFLADLEELVAFMRELPQPAS